jgi:hypothetical protein
MAERLYDMAISNTTNSKHFVFCFIPRTDQLYPGAHFEWSIASKLHQYFCAIGTARRNL